MRRYRIFIRDDDLVMMCVMTANERLRGFLKEKFPNQAERLSMCDDGVTSIDINGYDAIHEFLENVNAYSYEVVLKNKAGDEMRLTQPFMNQEMIASIKEFLARPEIGVSILTQLKAPQFVNV